MLLIVLIPAIILTMPYKIIKFNPRDKTRFKEGLLNKQMKIGQDTVSASDPFNDLEININLGGGAVRYSQVLGAGKYLINLNVKTKN